MRKTYSSSSFYSRSGHDLCIQRRDRDTDDPCVVFSEVVVEAFQWMDLLA